jgi:prophage tail gpP-like protein
VSPLEAPQLAETAISIRGERFRFWSSVSITRNIDSVDTVVLQAPFDPTDPIRREIFRPYSYAEASVDVGGSRVFTGTVLDPTPDDNPSGNIVSLSAYSRPGVLMDCTAPDSMYPLQKDNVKLDVIARELCEPFGIRVVFEASAGAAFERVVCGTTRKIYTFLADLAKQRSLILGSNTEGDLVFRQSVVSGNPVARLFESEPPLVSVKPAFSSQDMFSHVTGLEPMIVGLQGASYTERNSLLSGVLRPRVLEVTDGEEGAVQAAVQAEAGRMYGNAFDYVVEVATWFDQNDALWEPNTLVELTAPRAFVYNPYQMLVKSVRFDRDEDSERATLVLTVPEAYSGQIPERFPWDV